MKVLLPRPTTFEEIQATLAQEFPQYQVTIKKNPVLGFRYVQVRKSAMVGLWIRMYKPHLKLIGVMPDLWARFLFGFLFYLATNGARSIMRKECAAALEDMLQGRTAAHKPDALPQPSSFPGPAHQAHPSDYGAALAAADLPAHTFELERPMLVTALCLIGFLWTGTNLVFTLLAFEYYPVSLLILSLILYPVNIYALIKLWKMKKVGLILLLTTTVVGFLVSGLMFGSTHLLSIFLHVVFLLLLFSQWKNFS